MGRARLGPLTVAAGLCPGLLAVAVLAAAQGTAREPSVHTVLIDTLVTDARGRPIEALTLADFELREDGIVQPLDSVRHIRPGERQPDGATSPGRLFAIYLDEYHVSPGESTARARLAIARFFDEEVAPQDRFVVMKPLDSLLAIRVASDKDAARRIIDGFEGRRGVYTPRNDYEKNFMAGEPELVESARAQVALSAINALALNLAPLGEGRKTLIVVTEELGRTARRRGQEYLATLDMATRSANRSRVAVYLVDPRLRVDIAQELEARERRHGFATETGGLLIEGDLTAGLKRVGRESGSYYLLTYKAPHPENGRHYDVQVQLKRPNLDVRARANYWAPSPEDVLRAAVIARANEPRPPRRDEPTRRTSQLIRPWFGLSRGERGKTRVAVVWEPAPRVPGEKAPRVPARIEFTALAPDDSVVFSGTLLPSAGTPVTAGPGERSELMAVFDAAPGRLLLQMRIEDENLQQIDTDVRDLSIRDWRGPVVLGTPEILRARNAREFRVLEADRTAPPTSRREFSRTERLLVRFPAYAPPDAPPAVAARLLARNGQTMRELPVTAGPGSAERHQADLDLGALAPGEYMLELTATSAAGEARDRILFTVTN